MNEEKKKTANEIEESDLDQVSGGTAKDVDGLDIIIKKKPQPKPKAGAN